RLAPEVDRSNSSPFMGRWPDGPEGHFGRCFPAGGEEFLAFRGRRTCRGRFLVLVLHRRELEPILALDVDLDDVASRDLAAEQVLGKLVLDPARDDTPQRARAIRPVVTL